MNVVEPTAQTNPVRTLEPPQRLETGSIVTLRMRGHTRTAGLEYYAPAIVLAQHMPNGEIEVLVFDSTAGTHYNPAYSIRDISSRGDGAEREMYVIQSNIGQVLFSPDRFDEMMECIGNLHARIAALEGIADAAHAPLAVSDATPLLPADDAARRPSKKA